MLAGPLWQKPKTGETADICAQKRLTFKSSKTLLEYVKDEP